MDGPEAEEYFDRNGDGWRDAWNLVDIALREIESRTNIAGYEIDRSTPVKFGPLTEQGGDPGLLPLLVCVDILHADLSAAAK